MSTFIIAFIIFALAGLGIRHYIKGKGSCGDCECSCPVKEEMHRLIANKIIYRKMVSYSFKRPFLTIVRNV